MLCLQDIFSQSEDINLTASKSNPINGVVPSTEKPAELLSTPEGPPLPPETSSGEDLKIHELLSFPAAAIESSQQTSSQQTSLQTSSQPALISPKNAELLMPASVTNIITSRNGNVTGMIGISIHRGLHSTEDFEYIKNSSLLKPKTEFSFY
jgi:hypothetical protein